MNVPSIDIIARPPEDIARIHISCSETSDIFVLLIRLFKNAIPATGNPKDNTARMTTFPPSLTSFFNGLYLGAVDEPEFSYVLSIILDIYPSRIGTPNARRKENPTNSPYIKCLTFGSLLNT